MTKVWGLWYNKNSTRQRRETPAGASARQIKKSGRAPLFCLATFSRDSRLFVGSAFSLSALLLPVGSSPHSDLTTRPWVRRLSLFCCALEGDATFRSFPARILGAPHSVASFGAPHFAVLQHVGVISAGLSCSLSFPYLVNLL